MDGEIEKYHLETTQIRGANSGNGDNGCDLRNRGNIQQPDRCNPNQYPILIKGTEGHYVMWQTLNHAELVAKLPGVHEGTGKWIRVFEEARLGKVLSLGNIKACMGAK